MAGNCRFDKYNPVTGGFRAPLNAAILAASVGTMIGVSINASGKVVVGGTAASDIVGIIVPTEPMGAGDVIDVAQNCEVTGDLLTLGSYIYTHLDGVVDNVAATSKWIGVKVATAGATSPRCVIRVRPGAA